MNGISITAKINRMLFVYYGFYCCVQAWISAFIKGWNRAANENGPMK